MTSSSYFRFPHIHGDLITFVAEDDVWLAPLTGGRAWRVSSLQMPARNPRFSPDGKNLVWTVVQGSSPEAVTAKVDGGEFRQLTYFGHASTRVRGFTPEGEVVVTSAFEQGDFRLTHAYALGLNGGWARRLELGPVDSVVYGPVNGDERPVVVSSVLSREPAWWKRYKGGTAGKLWIDRDGNGEFVRLLSEITSNLADPMWIEGRIAFLSDHEGYGNIYSVAPDGSDLSRHTDFEEHYVRHAATDGTRIVFESAGQLFVMHHLAAAPIPLDISLGSASMQRRKTGLKVQKHLGEVVPGHNGSASAVESHGTIHWLTHKDGPARAIEVTPGVRARLPRPVGEDKIAYIADHGGEEALYIRELALSLPGLANTGNHTKVTGAVPPGAQHSTQHSTQPTTQLTTQPNLPVAAPAEKGEPAAAEDSDALPAPVSALSGSSVLSATPAAPSVTAALGNAAEVSNDESPANNTQLAENTAGENGLNTASVGIRFPSVTRASSMSVSPNGEWIAIGGAFGDLYLVEVAARRMSLLTSVGEGSIGDLAWSSDSKWLAFAEPLTAFGSRTRLRLVEVASQDSQIINVTDGRFADESPAFTPDGKFLAFLSSRSFDPVYDGHSFDLSFPSPIKPYLVALSANTPSPFGPAVASFGENTAETAAVRALRDGSLKEVEETPKLVVDANGIEQRILPLPVAQGNYSDLSAGDGCLYWLENPISGVLGDGRASTEDKAASPKLVRFDLAKRKSVTLNESVDSYRLSGDGKRIVFIKDKQVSATISSAKADEESGDLVKVDLGRIRVQLEPVAVWEQAFNEAWRLQRDFFWAADMGGLDWDGVKAKFAPIIQRLGSHDDLVDLLWEMHGELGTSHAYVRPFAVSEPGSSGQGRLGAEFVHNGTAWEITKILAGDSSDPLANSPLARAGVNAKVGDLLMAIDGVDLSATLSPAMLLTSSAGKAVELTVQNGQGHGEQAGVQRRVAVVPVRDEERLRYQEWVQSNRRMVRQASGDAFGYLHIPDMMAAGWAQLHRDLDTEASKDALIVDVRRNRGGHTSQLVAEIIGRKVTGWSVPRGEKPRTYPESSPRGPVVIVTDEFAGSDGDIITQVSKLRGIGPIVGTRTWGGVVGIDNRFSLADGTGVTQPRYATWFSGGVGWSVENYGVDPDIEVPFPPHAYSAGSDPQLEQSISVLREMLQELPTDQAPERAGYKTLKPAPLPPRKRTP
ncbi:S41 family peptidase [Pseudarthrobacter sp. J1738]|uniref:S41 family peptidase n=1 Tax=Pseudarthrobacter sp. J1738 TaxID=3420446 RepID=UPI003D2CA99F